MKSKPERFYDSDQIQKLIEKRYPAPAFTILTELRDSTGWAGAGRSADAVVFGTWPSRGFQIIGIEIKSYRGDWMKELKSPEKADSIGKYCDEWWIIASEGIVKIEEVPKSWGWAAPGENHLKTMKAAPVGTPVEINRTFLMSIVRNVEKSYVPRSSLAGEVKKMATGMREENSYQHEQRKSDLDALKKEVSDFERESGIKISDEWRHNGTDVGKVVHSILDSRFRQNIGRVRETAEACADLLTKISGLKIFD